MSACPCLETRVFGWSRPLASSFDDRVRRRCRRSCGPCPRPLPRGVAVAVAARGEERGGRKRGGRRNAAAVRDERPSSRRAEIGDHRGRAPSTGMLRSSVSPATVRPSGRPGEASRARAAPRRWWAAPGAGDRSMEFRDGGGARRPSPVAAWLRGELRWNMTGAQQRLPPPRHFEGGCDAASTGGAATISLPAGGGNHGDDRNGDGGDDGDRRELGDSCWTSDGRDASRTSGAPSCRGSSRAKGSSLSERAAGRRGILGGELDGPRHPLAVTLGRGRGVAASGGGPMGLRLERATAARPWAATAAVLAFSSAADSDEALTRLGAGVGSSIGRTRPRRALAGLWRCKINGVTLLLAIAPAYDTKTLSFPPPKARLRLLLLRRCPRHELVQPLLACPRRAGFSFWRCDTLLAKDRALTASTTA